MSSTITSEPLQTAVTRLGASLIRIHAAIDEDRLESSRQTELFHKWQDRWARQSELLNRRLRLIESQLEESAPQPLLSVFAADA